ncbi:MAG TPA: DUF5908 family protein [Bacteroidales bacterium]|nr:DUF5908 family protein [Bacteroidales bacterium]
MPLEIRELHIKAKIVDKKNTSALKIEDLRREQEVMRKEIVQECVRETLQILEDRRER